MTRYGASTREYSRTDDDADTHHPIRTSDRASARTDSARERTTFHSGRGGTAISSDDDESEYGGYRQHHRGVARDGNGGTRRRHHHRREDPVIERLRREVREEEARRRVDGEDYAYTDVDDEDDAFALPRRTVMSRGGARATGGVTRAGTGDGNGNGNGGTHGRRHCRREDPVIERLRREVREEEARLSGLRCACSDDSEGETGFGREVGAGNGVWSCPRGHFDDSEDDGMEGGCRGVFCGGRRSRV